LQMLVALMLLEFNSLIQIIVDSELQPKSVTLPPKKSKTSPINLALMPLQVMEIYYNCCRRRDLEEVLGQIQTYSSETC
jgi:hypothetical protein